MTLRDRALAVTVAVLWGVNFLAVRFGLDHFPPLLLGSVRFVLVAVPTVLFVPRPRGRVRWLVGYGVGFGVAQFGLLFLAMARGLPTGLASLVLQCSAPFTVLLAAGLLGERPVGRQLAGVVAAVAGLATIAVQRSIAGPVLPLVLCLLAGLGWAAGNVCSRRAAPDEPLRFALWMSLVPPIPLFALSWLVEGPRAIGAAFATSVTPAGLPGLAGLAYVVLGATLVGQTLWTGLLARHGAGTVAPYSMLVPVVGIGLSVLVLGERPSWLELAAASVIVAGVLLGTPRPGAAAGRPGELAMARATPAA